MCVVAPPIEMWLDIVTRLPPDTGVIDITLSVTVLVMPATVADLYTQVLPAAIGNGTEFEDTTDVEPPPELFELELVLDDELLELLELALPPDEPPVLEPPDDPPPQAASRRPAAATMAAAALARPRAE